jgi:beta-N-acetylhexosaminidase
MINGLKDAVKSGRIPEARLNESVRKQLAWKYELGLAKEKMTPIDQIDRAVSGSESAALTEEIAEKAITLVRDDGGQIPMNKSAKVAVLGISNGFDGPSTMNTLVRTFGQNGVRFTPVYVQENSTAEQIAAARKAVSEADVVVAGLYGRVRSGAKNSVGIPENGAAILRDMLASDKKVIGVSFGNPYILSSFPQMKTYLVAYGDMPSLQRAAARAVLGVQDITGRLPISLPGLYPRGTGIQRLKK